MHLFNCFMDDVTTFDANALFNTTQFTQKYFVKYPEIPGTAIEKSEKLIYFQMRENHQLLFIKNIYFLLTLKLSP